MIRGQILMVVGLMIAVAGCSSSPVVVKGEADEEMLTRLSRYDVEEEDLRFQVDQVEVHATVTRPVGASAVPGVVLVAGSGPTDRDWNNPLLPGDNGTAIELSARLAATGVAVLRYDKRGTGSTALNGVIQWEDYLDEVEAAVDWLRADAGTDEGRIFVAGHSEGGVHALRAVAEQRVEVAGLILLAAPGRSMSALILDQVEDQLVGVGLSEEAVDNEVQRLKRALDAFVTGRNVQSAQVSEIPGIVAMLESLQMEEARGFASEILPWEPTQAIKEVSVRLLLLQGLKDTQVDAERDAHRLLAAAEEAGREVELVLAGDADHVFKHQSRPREELGPQHSLVYNDPTRHLDRAALAAMVRWILSDQRSGDAE